VRLEVYKCNRCGDKSDEEEYSKRWLGLCRLNSSEEDLHLCGTCKNAFYVWLEMIGRPPAPRVGGQKG